jgi:6-carboxyhexanoate--CoA ligase
MQSLRMRASRANKHISGAERLLSQGELADAVQNMLQRALSHSRGPADRISICVEEVFSSQLKSGCLPEIFNNQVNSWQQGRDLAKKFLHDEGVSHCAIEAAMMALTAGASPAGESMRGAMLIDIHTGERLEPDRARGVRASRMDLTESARQQLVAHLSKYRLDNLHVIEALTLAAKVMSTPFVVAELCWSDDPDYLAGYVASRNLGYQRINLLKPLGEERGGRAFFVSCSKAELPVVIDWLENQPLLIDRLGWVHPPHIWNEVP